MDYINLLFSKKPYGEKTDKLFTAAIRQNFGYQTAHCPQYARIASHYGIREDMIRDIRSIVKLPPLPTLLFKRNKIMSAKPFYTVSSSGTSGNKSQIGLDADSLVCALKMSFKTVRERELLSPVPCHYIIMGYRPRHDNCMAASKTAFCATLTAPAIDRSYILEYKNGGYRLEFEQVVNKICGFEKSLFPVRFMGFPSYMYFIMKSLDERGKRVKLPKGSKIMLGGGWKQFYADKVDKRSFYELAYKVLGIADCDIIEFFGAAEHPILYCDCKNHHFHIPSYSRVIIRDVNTLQPLPYGKKGIVNLITPLIKATPVLSVLTDDIGVMHRGSECGCGITSPYLEIVGRTAPNDIKTCAAGAEEFLKGVSL